MTPEDHRIVFAASGPHRHPHLNPTKTKRGLRAPFSFLGDQSMIVASAVNSTGCQAGKDEARIAFTCRPRDRQKRDLEVIRAARWAELHKFGKGCRAQLN